MRKDYRRQQNKLIYSQRKVRKADWDETKLGGNPERKSKESV